VTALDADDFGDETGLISIRDLNLEQTASRL
jgi:hypothetical protein